MESTDKNQKAAAAPADKMSRASFLTKIWTGLGLVAIAEFCWVFLTFLKPRETRTNLSSGEVVVAGPVEEFALNSVTAFSRGRFYLSRLENGGFQALSRKCTHLGCTVVWNAETRRFDCPCHSSAFDSRGNVISPPAPRGLDCFLVTIENQIVKVDTGSSPA